MSNIDVNANRVRLGNNNLAPYSGGQTTNQPPITEGELYQGVLNCSGNPNYPAATENMYWKVSVAGLIGGAAGTAVKAGDDIICITTNAGGVQSAVGADFMIVAGLGELGTVTSTNYISATGTVNANLSALDVEVKALSLSNTAVQIATATIGWSGAGAGFTALLSSAANMIQDNVDLGAIVPANSRVLDVVVVNTAASTFSGGATTLTAAIGNAPAGTQFSTAQSVYALGAIAGSGAAMSAPVAINTSASHVWVGMVPGANWSTQTGGTYLVYVTYVTYQ